MISKSKSKVNTTSKYSKQRPAVTNYQKFANMTINNDNLVQNLNLYLIGQNAHNRSYDGNKELKIENSISSNAIISNKKHNNKIKK